MKIVLQRVRSAEVIVNSAAVGKIGRGALLLVGVGQGDTEADAVWLANKVRKLRVYDDADGRLNAAIDEVGGSYLAVSQFTLFGDCRKGNRPSYIGAAPPAEGERLYDFFVEKLRGLDADVQTGVFGADMLVRLENDGPVTLILESNGR